MRVARVRVEGYCGPTVYNEVEGALAELRELMAAALAGDDDDPIHITFAEMSEEEFAALPEFAGY